MWSFRISFESFTESDCSTNSSGVALQQFTHDEMTEDELGVFKALSGHQELFFEQIEHKELGYLHYSTAKLKTVQQQDAARAKDELAEETASKQEKFKEKKQRLKEVQKQDAAKAKDELAEEAAGKQERPKAKK